MCPEGSRAKQKRKLRLVAAARHLGFVDIDVSELQLRTTKGNQHVLFIADWFSRLTWEILTGKNQIDANCDNINEKLDYAIRDTFYVLTANQTVLLWADFSQFVFSSLNEEAHRISLSPTERGASWTLQTYHETKTALSWIRTPRRSKNVRTAPEAYLGCADASHYSNLPVQYILAKRAAICRNLLLSNWPCFQYTARRPIVEYNQVQLECM